MARTSHVSSSGHKPPSREWARLLRLIPGYDAIATAENAFFVPSIAQDALDFFPECLTHIEGDLYDKPFILEPWEQAIVANLFGWQMLDDRGRQVRRYREFLLYVPKKNGKSPFCSGLALLILFNRRVDGEMGQQNYMAAGDKLQAGKMFRYAQAMVKAKPALRERCRIYGGNASAGQTKSIVIEDENSFVQILSADADTKEGNTSHLVLVDELHVQPDRRLVDSLTTSLASENRKQPLVGYLTTADYDRLSICNEVYDRAVRVRDGRTRNARFLPVIYEAPRYMTRAQYAAFFPQLPLPEVTDGEIDRVELDYTNPVVYRDQRIWAIANPNLGVSVSRAYLETDSQKASEVPGYLPTFLRLHLNVRTKQATLWLNMQRWDASAGAMLWHEMEEALKGRACYAGLDIGSTSDLTSLSLLFPNTDGSYDALWWNWVPEDTAKDREKRGDVAYLEFIQRGILRTTPGNETDYSLIRDEINEIANDYGIREIGADRKFQGAQLCQDLLKDGFDVIPVNFGILSITAATEEFARLVNRGEMHHGGNPLVRWAAGNVFVQPDSGGNIKPDKARSADKIDPIVSVICALQRAMVREPEPTSVYETRGVLII